MNIQDIAKKVAATRLRYYSRDLRMNEVRAVRASELDRVAPGLLADDFPKPFVCNVINVAAQYSSEQIGVMPTISCTTGVMVSDRQKKYAQRRTLIAHNYLENRRVKTNLVEASDWMNTYSFLPVILEPHFGDAYCEAVPDFALRIPWAATTNSMCTPVRGTSSKCMTPTWTRSVRSFLTLRMRYARVPTPRVTRSWNSSITWTMMIWFGLSPPGITWNSCGCPTSSGAARCSSPSPPSSTMRIAAPTTM